MRFVLAVCGDRGRQHLMSVIEEVRDVRPDDVVDFDSLGNDADADFVLVCPETQADELRIAQWMGNSSASAVLVYRGLTGGASAAEPDAVETFLRCAIEQAARFRVRPPEADGDAATNGELSGLTARELEILRLTAQGLSISQIAKEIHRSANTVASHRRNLHRKLGLDNRVELTRFAIKAGLIEP